MAAKAAEVLQSPLAKREDARLHRQMPVVVAQPADLHRTPVIVLAGEAVGADTGILGQRQGLTRISARLRGQQCGEIGKVSGHRAFG